MKALIVLLLSCVPMMAMDTILTWESNTNGIAGYRVHVGTNTHSYYATNTVAGAANTNLVLLGLTSGKTYYFSVSSVTTGGLESDLSQELVAVIPTPPTNLKLRTTTQVSLSANGPWQDLTNVDVMITASQTNRFYRSRVDFVRSQFAGVTAPPVPMFKVDR